MGIFDKLIKPEPQESTSVATAAPVQEPTTSEDMKKRVSVMLQEKVSSPNLATLSEAIKAQKEVTVATVPENLPVTESPNLAPTQTENPETFYVEDVIALPEAEVKIPVQKEKVLEPVENIQNNISSREFVLNFLPEFADYLEAGNQLQVLLSEMESQKSTLKKEIEEVNSLKEEARKVDQALVSLFNSKSNKGTEEEVANVKESFYAYQTSIDKKIKSIEDSGRKVSNEMLLKIEKAKKNISELISSFGGQENAKLILETVRKIEKLSSPKNIPSELKTGLNNKIKTDLTGLKMVTGSGDVVGVLMALAGNQK